MINTNLPNVSIFERMTGEQFANLSREEFLEVCPELETYHPDLPKLVSELRGDNDYQCNISLCKVMSIVLISMIVIGGLVILTYYLKGYYDPIPLDLEPISNVNVIEPALKVIFN